MKNKINRRSSKNNCKIVLLTVVLFYLFSFIFIYTKNVINNNTLSKDIIMTEEQESFCTELTSNNHLEITQVKEDTENESELVLKETEEVAVVEIRCNRINKLYCIIEDGWVSTPKYEYLDYLWAMCEKYDVTEYYELFIAQMYRESTFRPDVISGTNDYGLFQINKQNHKWLGNILGSYDFLDPYTNIEAGVYLMSNYLSKYKDAQKALVCYNRGESAVKKGIYSTKYSRRVLYGMTLLVEIEN